MTKKEFGDYTVEELICDQEFTEIVQNISTEEEWQQFLEANKDSKEKILIARKFISLFWIKEEHPDPDKRHELWIRIRDFDKTNLTENRTHRIRHFIRVAASILVIISVSSILYLCLNNRGSDFNFADNDHISSSENTVLKLTNGEKIEVRKEEVKIAILENEALQIDNDTIHCYASDETYSKEDIALNELVIPYGKKSTLVLSDGTKVWLNAGTRFAFPNKFTGKKRQVYLDGEAYFEVSENKNQAFIVSTQNLSFEVLGTKFSVNAYSNDELSEAVLLEGIIEVWSENRIIKEKIRMSPNQKAVYRITDKEILIKTEPDAQNHIAWIDGWYTFSNENLEQVLIKIGRYYNVTFQYDDLEIKNALPISGKLDLKESFDDVMLILSKVARIEYKTEGNNVIIN